jgi:trimeric autotransporter adhesin
MRKIMLVLAMLLLLAGSTFAALTGVKTIGVDYSTIAAAIADLNTQGVGPGGVTFNVPANYTETFTNPLDGYITTTTGSSASPVVFQKSGAGSNPVVTAAVGTGTMDAIIAIAGCDYVTFDGINLAENPANTTATTEMEWGYAILKASPGDGSQYITIKNCSISLTTAYTATIGIYANNHNTTSTTQLISLTLTGGNSNLKIYSNTVNCYTGISITGYNDISYLPQYFDQNNEIGKDGANIITNVAGQGSNGYGIYASYQNNIKVANNVVTSTMGGTGSPSIYGIYLTSASNSNVDLYNNTVTINYSGSGTANLYTMWCDMGGLGQYNTVNIYNNTVTGCTYSTLTSGTVRFMNFNNLGVNGNIYGNSVTNNTVGSATVTATGQVYYIACNKNSPVYGPLNLYNNTVTGNTRLQLVPGSSTTYYINVIGSASLARVYNNTVTNNVIAAQGSTYGISVSPSIASLKVFDNTITGMTQANGVFYGINLNSGSLGTNNEIYRNRIQNIQGDLAGSTIHGIYVSNAGTSCFAYVYNNLVSDFRTPAGLSATNPGLTGINIQGADYIGVYNNSVYLNGTSSAATFNTAALYSVTSMGFLDLKNNILVNTSTPMGTGVTAAIRLANTTITKITPTSNNNTLYAGTPGISNLIFYDGTNKDQTLTAYKAHLYPRESQSVTEMPPFVSITPASTNLHLQTSVATQCESGGSVISVPAITTDFDNNPRFPNTGYPVGSVTPFAPDMGADEFGGTPNDLTPPAIAYSALAPTNLTAARTLTVTITDGNGVPTSGPGLPMLYWKVNAGSYVGVQGVFVSGSTYTFSFGAGVATGDIVSYYVVAQDMSPAMNVIARPSTGATGYSVNPPACSTAPATPESYTIVPSFTGVFHVGVGKDYATLTAAAADVNAKVLTGPVTLILDDATYPSEIYPVSFNANAGSSPVNTLTLKPNTGVSPLLEANVTTGILDLNGIDYLTIDGSNNGTNSRNLTISNPCTSTGAAFYAISLKNSGTTDPATNVTIRNCILRTTRLDQSSSASADIHFFNTGGGYDNIVIDHNTIHTGFTGIHVYGASTWKATNIRVTNNTIGSTVGTEAISKYGVDVQNADNVVVEGNEIMGPSDGSLNPAQSGVVVSTGATNVRIRKNNIHTFWRPSDDGWGCTGIYMSTDASTPLEISNNVIYDIHSGGSASGPAQSNTYGIFARNGGNFRIVHNTINLTGPYLSATLDASSACIGFYQQVVGGNIEIRDNILRNGQTSIGGAPMLNGKAYGIIVCSDASMFSNINNNDYYLDGTDGSVGQFFTQQMVFNYKSLASWQAYTGQEANSVNLDPVFTSPTNMIPTTTAMPHAGSYISWVPTDITGINRTNPPDIGAYEFSVNPLITTVSASPVSNTTATLNGSANANNTTFNLFFDYGLTTSYGSTLTAAPSSVTGTTLNTMSAGAAGLTPLTTYHFRARGVTTGGLIVYGNDMTFTTLPNPPTVVTTAATGVTGTGATLNGTINANTSNATASFEYGLTTSYGTVVSATPGSVSGSTTTPISAAVSGLLPNALYHYRAIGTNITGTSYGNDMTFTTTPVLSLVVTDAPSIVGTTSAQLNGTVMANNAATTVTFQWGMTTSYGNTIAAIPATVNGMLATAVMASLSGLNINTTYHYRCVGVNAAGTTYGLDQFFTTNCVAPVVTISGPATVCAASTGNVYTTQAGNSNYVWTVSPGGTITAGAGTNAITVTWNTVGAQTVSVNYSNGFGCSAAAPSVYNVTVNAQPTPTITGPATVCQFTTGNTYTTQAGMSGYVWTVSAGGTITSGAGTNAVQVTWNGTGAQTVNVNYNNASGCSATTPTTYNVLVNAAPAPTISGTNSLCENSGFYFYSTEAGMSGYIWTVSAGGTINSGQGTNQVQVTWNTTGAQTISVNYSNSNGCFAATATVLNVTVNALPGAAGTITGTSAVCGGALGVAYSVAPVANAVTYVWILPAGATVASGSGTNSITVDFAANASSGNITVYGNNLCGNGNSSPAFPVAVTPLPGDPGTISGQTEICRGTTGVVYSVNPITGVTDYNWTVPSGATIVSGNNTNSITVDYGMTAVSGNVTVNGSNNCGSGVTSTLAISVNAIPAAPVIDLSGSVLTSSAATGNQWYYEGSPIPGAEGQTYDAALTGSGWYWSMVTLNGCMSDTSNHIYVLITGIGDMEAGSCTIYPVPNDGRFTISLKGSATWMNRLTVMNSLGEKVFEANGTGMNGTLEKIVDLRPAPAGLYTVIIETPSQRIIKKIIINK